MLILKRSGEYIRFITMFSFQQIIIPTHFCQTIKIQSVRQSKIRHETKKLLQVFHDCSP